MSTVFDRGLTLRIWGLIILAGGVAVMTLGAVFFFSTTTDGVVQCSKVMVSTSKTDYVRGETANIFVDYVHLTQYCSSVDSGLHEIIVDANGLTIARWNTTSDSSREVNWTTPSSDSFSATFAIRACQWLGGTQLLECASTTVRVGSYRLQMLDRIAAGIALLAAGGVIAIIGSGYRLRRRRSF